MYKPDLTFDANATRLGNLKGPGRDQDVSNALRDAYTDGWMDALAEFLATGAVSEEPRKS